MSTSHRILKLARQLHLFTGLFIAPAILFFALSGALQTFNLHENSHTGGAYKPPTWIVTLSQIHKHQTATIPVRKPRPDADAPKHDKHADQPASTTPRPPEPPQKTHTPMKIFFLIVSIGLFTSTLTGIYMAYRFNRSKLVMSAVLLAGILVPVILLRF
ncbi:MAG: PepSY domain-containing protein [Acidobacteriaceae bacterium]